jgi:D-sedoheptulose 7-phosphate isomerase
VEKDNLASLNLLKMRLQESSSLKHKISQDQTLMYNILKVVKACIKAFSLGNKVMFCGNGGSAADAQHLASELSGRFYFDRPPLNAEALHVNSSYITAVANDYSYSEIFARLVKGSASKGDVLIGLSTSGNSLNIVKAFQAARHKGVITIALTGDSGGELKSLSDLLIAVPAIDTARIQECHITIGHIICELIEKNIFSAKHEFEI